MNLLAVQITAYIVISWLTWILFPALGNADGAVVPASTTAGTRV